MPPPSAPVPSVVAPSLKVTMPVGVPPVPLTVAVKVTPSPDALGLGVAESAVVLLVALTFCVRLDEVLPEQLVSPA